MSELFGMAHQIDVIDLTVGNVSNFIIFMRAVTVAVWGVALQRIWISRQSPVANLVMVAALAVMGSVITLILHEAFTAETLAFFLASGQIAMAIAVVRMFRWLSHHPVAMVLEREVKAQRENGGFWSEWKRRPIYNCLTALSTIVGMGTLYFIFVYLDRVF